MTTKATTQHHLSLALFAGALFLSAALMFAVQPMVGKMLLPLVGGTPSGWIVTMAFFQVMLLLGYLAAHALSRFPPLVHGAVYAAMLGAGCVFLPIHITPPPGGTTPGAVDIFTLLAMTAAVPFIAISATSSTLQRLFTASGHPSAKDPYFLYAASNLGSFMGLFLYPLVFEPLWGNVSQAKYWYGGFVVLLMGVLLCLLNVSDKKAVKENTRKDTKPATGKQRLEWILLSFVPSALLLAVTTHITTDSFSAPMIWVAPLAIYLLTFVIAFARRQVFNFKDVARLHHILLPLAVALLCVYNFNIRISIYAMAFHLFAFGVTALVCHMRLAAVRPQASQLTDYYLMMSVGGALGGLLNAFILPVVLDRLVEYPVLLLLSCLLLPAFREKMQLVPKMMLAFAGFCGFIHFLFIVSNNSFIAGSDVERLANNMMMADFILLTIAVMLGFNMKTAFYGGVVMLLVFELILPRDVVLTTRNFYGVIKVFERPVTMKGKDESARYMYHGTTTHGIQVEGKQYEKLPTAYFWGAGPVADVFALYKPKNIAVMGLGAGTMNCYSNKTNEFTFFEIDPAVKRVAEEAFTFLKACKGKREPKIILGDGRIELSKQKEKYDLIALDAFSSDTIPSHLLTLDAVNAYMARLGKGGILLFNLSNRYFTLASPLLRIAQELELKTRFVLDVPPPEAAHAAASIWFVMARPDTDLSKLDDFGWVELQAPEDAPLWTDDHTDMMSVLSFRPALAPARKKPDAEE